MGRQRKWTDDDLRKAVEVETTWPGVQKRLGLRPCGTAPLRVHADRVGLDYSHLVVRNARRWTDDDLRRAVKDSESVSQVIRVLGLKATGRSFDHVIGHVRRLGLSTSHFTGKAWVGSRGNRQHPSQKYTLETIFCEGSCFATSRLLPVLLREGYKERCCESCGLTEWRDVQIPIEVDHVNGVSNDHRLENLRLLCPNCHALTPTWRGRKRAEWLRVSSS